MSNNFLTVAGKRKKRGLKVFWFPKSHGHHKHTKNKYYVSHGEDSPTESIMSGDSPNAHRNEVFDFKEAGRTSPTPTTSKDASVQSGNPIQASVLVEPSKDKEKDKDKEDENKEDFCSPILNHSGEQRRNSDPEKTLTLEELSYSGKKHEKKDEKKKLNGDFDKLDGVWVPNKKAQEDEDDSCVVKCLYVTLQCCECSIM